ncbi:MAG: hypothetical protein V2G48_03390 [bacterium JZ-2024 1]
MKGFECTSCREIVVAKREPYFCPMCRSRMLPVPVVPENLVWFTCGECGGTFAMQEKHFPYKCPWCNFTIQKTKYKHIEERL